MPAGPWPPPTDRPAQNSGVSAGSIAKPAVRLYMYRRRASVSSRYEADNDMETPCIDVCTMDPASGLCRGCGRTLDEIAAWSVIAEAERRRIMLALPERMARAGLPRASHKSP